MVRATIETKGIWLSGSSIQSPGRVKARPPATMAPALMMVWVQLISWIVLPLQCLSAAMLTTVTKMVGQGRAPMRRATYMLLAVMTRRPSSPITNALQVSCLSIATS